MYACPFPGCTHVCKTPSGIRKHWTSLSGHIGDVPKLFAAEIAISEKHDMTVPCGAGLLSDMELINMMGLSGSQIDTRSSGRFSRSSGLSSQRTGTCSNVHHMCMYV
jgi:hypothetical protein